MLVFSDIELFVVLTGGRGAIAAAGIKPALGIAGVDTLEGIDGRLSGRAGF